MQTMRSNDSDLIKYGNLRRTFAKMFSQKKPFVLETNKEKLTKAVPTIKKVFNDDEMPYLFKNLIPDGEFTKTSDFIRFLEKVVKDDEG
jgi:hypothetical protein